MPRRSRKSSGIMSRVMRNTPEWVKVTVLAILSLIFFGLGGVIIWASLVPIPSIDSFESRQVAQSTKIYDRTGTVVLYDVHGQVRRTSVSLDEISPYIQNATIAAEDDTFYTNPGINVPSLARAILADLTSGGYAQGGSTITQQVVKNALLTQEKTVTRKIEEIILALRLTRVYSKQQILNTYLNESPYGGTIYGVQEAAQYYFGVDAKDVDLAQAAYLAALPQAPTYYSPYGNHKADLDARKNFILDRMLALGLISQDEHDAAVKEQVEFRVETTAGIKAPHFVFYIQEYLEQKYGVDAVQNGGLKVITTLDWDLQQKGEDIVSQHADEMQADFNASNEGMVAIDPTTGQILAMIGSRDYFNNDIQGQVNVTTANRQPGSTFKPFVYATAFEKGYTPDTVVFDVPTQFSTACAPSDITNSNPPCFAPQNYDGKFKGPMTLRDAISQSENIPSVKVEWLAGIADSIKTAQDMGITTLGDPSQYGLTLVLGGGETNLVEMTGAYGVFANDGVKNPPTGILQVQDQSGNILESYQPQPQRVLDPQIARLVNDILSDDTARSPEFGVHGVLWFPNANVADKTGTTNDSRDAWVIGYTPGIVVGAWAGNNDNTPMVKKIAAFIVAPMWHDFMEYATQKYPAQNDFVPPAPDPQQDSLPPVLTGNWNTDPSQGIHDILYWVQRDNPRAGKPANPASDPQFAYWEYGVENWVNGGGLAAMGLNTNSASPSGSMNTTQGGGEFFISTPTAGTVVPFYQPLVFSAQNNSGQSIANVTYYMDGQLVGSSTAPPYTVTVMPNSHGPVQLRAVALLDSGATLEQTITFTIQ
jgi:1A family penicillin-binding protein